MKSNYCDFVSLILAKSVDMIVGLQATKENTNLEPI